MVRKTVTIATLDTRNFTFQAAGGDHRQAETALIETLKVHGKEYSLPTNWFSDLILEAKFRSFGLGQIGRRDGEAIS